jgi:hypothetical protein
MASCKGIRLVNVVGVIDFCHSLYLDSQYAPSQINILSLSPFPDLFPSLTVTLFATGGCNCMGFKSAWEVVYAKLFMHVLIGDFTSPRSNFKQAEWEASRARAMISSTAKRVKKRKKKIEKWSTECAIGKRDGLYQKWADKKIAAMKPQPLPAAVIDHYHELDVVWEADQAGGPPVMCFSDSR